MTTCERLSDRMPQVLRGEQSWTAAEVAHLASCADCAAEWRLIGAAAELGARLPAVDSARIAIGVQQRLASAPPDVVPIVQRRPFRWAVGLAAAAAVVLAVRMASPGGGSRPIGTGPSIGVLSELDELTGQELVSVLEVLDSERLAPSVEGPGLGDLTSDELEHLLRSWEG